MITKHPLIILFILIFFFGIFGLAKNTLAANYYVTQSGAGSHNGTVGNEWSVANFNADNTPTGGDTVYFAGTITSSIVPNTSGTGNGTSRLTLDFNGATLATTASSPRISINAKNYLNVNGGTFAVASGGQYDITFTNHTSHDVTIQNWTHINTDQTNTWGFMHITNLYNGLIQNNHIQYTSNFIDGDGNPTHDVIIQNNFWENATNADTQADGIMIGDAYNITIQGNKLIQRDPGAVSGNHNDCIQTFKGGGGNGANPYGWIVRYNWIEADVASGSGDTSWMMMENMLDNGSTKALKIYSNVFVGRTGTVTNNGVAVGSSTGGTYYFYNNTLVLNGSTPENTIRFLSPGTVYSANNIGYAASSPGTSLSWTMTEGGDWNPNFFHHFDNCSATYSGVNGSCSTDPLFNNYAGDDFSLATNSPLIGEGVSLGAEYASGIASGATWPNPTLVTRTNWDIGAYEYVSGEQDTTPPASPMNLTVK